MATPAVSGLRDVDVGANHRLSKKNKKINFADVGEARWATNIRYLEGHVSKAAVMCSPITVNRGSVNRAVSRPSRAQKMEGVAFQRSRRGSGRTIQ